MGWADSAADGATGGRGGYGGGAGSGRGGGGGFDGRDTPGSPNAADGRRGSTMGRDGGRASDAGNGGIGPAETHTNIPGARNHSAPPDSDIGVGINTGTRDNPSLTTRADMATRTGRRNLGFYSQLDTAAVTDGAIASFADAVDTVEAQPDPEAGFMGQMDATPMSMAETTAQAQQAIDAQASPGPVGRAFSFGVGLLASPLAGMAVDTAARGYNAAQTAKAHNAEFGTNVDTDVASNIGRQAVGAVGGLAGSRGGGLLGGRIVAAAGPYGQLAGTMAGSMAGKSFGRSVAMDAMNGTPGDAGSPGPSGGMGDGNGAPDSATMTASLPPSTTAQRAAAPAFGYADFNGYASYAENFFG